MGNATSAAEMAADEAVGGNVELGELYAAAYAILRGLARSSRRRWFGQDTMCTTALVHEAYLKLARQDSPHWQSRGHFLNVASRAMRHILIDYAERSRAAKRGGEDGVNVQHDEVPLVDQSRIEELLDLNDALTRLERQHPRQARVVECRVFAGLEVEDTAEALGISQATVMRDWRRGKAWLHIQLHGGWPVMT